MAKNSGYMLIELIIVIAIFGLSTTCLIPWMFQLLQRQASYVVRDQLIAVIRAGQRAAQVLQTPVAVCAQDKNFHCQQDWLQGQTIFLNPKKDGRVGDHKNILQILPRVKLRQGMLHFRLFPRHKDYLLFSPEDYFANTNGSFWFCLANKINPEWAIVFNQLGRPRIVVPNKHGVIRVGERELHCELSSHGRRSVGSMLK